MLVLVLVLLIINWCDYAENHLRPDVSRISTPDSSEKMLTRKEQNETRNSQHTSPREVSCVDTPEPQPDYKPQPLPPPLMEGEGSASIGCKRRTLALKPNRSQRRAAQRSQQRCARLAASLDARRQVLIGAAKDALAERLAAIPPLARRRRVAMWRRRWRRERRRHAGDRGGSNHTALTSFARFVAQAESGAVPPQQARPRTFWDKVWAVPIRIWNALMRAYYGNKLRASDAETAVLMAFNVDGRMRLRGRGVDTEDWGNGADLKAEATADWKRVLDMMEGRALVVLSDLCVNGHQLRAIVNRLQLSGPWQCHGTPGHHNAASGQWSGGVLMAWDRRVYVAEAMHVLRHGRLIEVRLQDCRAQQALTVFGAYMPGRGLPERQVIPAWEGLGEAVADAGPGRIIMGDLNAEMTTALLREGREAQLADERLQHLCGEEGFVTAGPDQATYQSNGRNGLVRSQIDHILCDEYAAMLLGESEVLAGLSEHDHRVIEAGLLRKVDAHAGPERLTKLPLWLLTTKEWQKFEEESGPIVSQALELLSEEASPAQRLRTIEEALMKLVRTLLPTRPGSARPAPAPGSGGHRSAMARIRSDIGRWEALCRVAEQRHHTHQCYMPACGRGKRRAFTRTRELVKTMQASALTTEQRRNNIIEICQRQLARSQKELAALEVREGDGFVDAFEEAINEGGEGGAYVRLFEILKMATGKGKPIKWRGQKQEGKTRWKARGVPPVKLSALYKDGDKERGVVVTGAKAVLDETRAQAAKINGTKQTFPAVAEALMAQIRPFPAQPEARERWAREVCTWERFERAVGRAGADVGVGADGYSGYLTRKASGEVRRVYYETLLDMLTAHSFPPEWKLWECVLLMKPGEDPREFGRRRDIWLMPHSLKVASRMLMFEYEEVACRYVPSSQSGFTKDHNACAQTLVMRLHRERCREQRQGYYVAYADMGSYFMSICKEIMLKAEQWSGTRVEVSAVLRAMQDGLKGRVETAYGMTEPHDMPGVACGQGHECSPVRSKIMASFIQEMATRVCRGYRFGQTGTPQVWYADDSAWLCEDLAGVQMALDSMWVVARISGLQVSVNSKGTKTAWMGTYYDAKGVEHSVTGAKVMLPDGREVPQVKEYKYLGTPLKDEYKGRHDEMRKKVVRNCIGLIRQIGRVDMLGPRQTRKVMELAIAGVLGYYARSTPMTWADCQSIEAVRLQVLAQRGICAAAPRAAVYLPEEAGGAGHEHAYGYAAAAYLDQFHRALSGGLGEPARIAVSERIAETCRRLGCTGSPLEWEPPEDIALSEDHMVEAWLRMKREARMRGVRTEAVLESTVAACGVCGVWRGRGEGCAPRCESTLCPGGREPTEEGVGKARKIQDGVSGEVLQARRTAECFGDWEYLMERDGVRVWIPHVRMEATREQRQRLLEAQQHRRQAHSLRDALETRFGGRNVGSVGQMQAAITGKASEPETERRLADLVNVFLAHAAAQCESEMPGAPWPNLQEVSREQGYRGVVHSSEVDISYYRGGSEQALTTGTDGIGVLKTRSCMSLEPRQGSWEERLPVHLRVRPDEVSRVVAAGDQVPEGAPHMLVNLGGLGVGPWRHGNEEAGYSQASNVSLRSDPVARLHLRLAEFENGSVNLATRGGVEIPCGQVNQDALETVDGGGRQGDKESAKSLLEVCLPLHYRHRFTRAASVDGSADEPRRRGGSDRKRVSYGVYEGMLPEAEVAEPRGGWDSLTDAERAARCLGAGMWGGALPQDWDNNDAEAYAILRYLRSVVDRSDDPEQERVLVLSDSRAVLDSIEAIWRSQDMAPCKARDRGAMIEAICALRARFGRVVFVWNPGHRGIIHNEMADCCAKAHLDQPVADDVTRQIAGLVRTRDCLYEIESEYQDGTWVLADRRCFRLARQCMRRWVRRQLLSSVNTLRYDAKLADGMKYNYGESGYCTEVVKGFGTGKKVAPGVTCEHMRDDARRVGFVMGRRAGDSGLPHERGHTRLLSQFEGDDDGSEIDDDEERCLPCGELLTAAQRNHRLGCVGCKPWLPDGACEGCGGWLGRPAGSLPYCKRAGCPGAADAEGWVTVRPRGRMARSPTKLSAKEVSVASWSVPGDPQVGARLSVVGYGKTRKDGARGSKVKLALETQGTLGVRVRIHAPREAEVLDTRFRLSAAQVRREDALYQEDPRAEARGGSEWQGGADRAARTRKAQTVAERLRREGAHEHEDARFDIGPARSLADLRHVMCECQGTEGRARRVEGLIEALDGLTHAVPKQTDTQAYHRVTVAARAALEASDKAALNEAQWQHVDDVLAAFLPDFARTESTADQRREMIHEVVEALLVVHGRAASLVQSWRQTHKNELERRQQQEKYRGLMRTIVRAWREEADGRKARSLRIAVPKGTMVEEGRHTGRIGSGDCLSTEHVPWRPAPERLRAVLQDPDNADLPKELQAERRRHESRGEMYGARLSADRSAVPAGSLARLLLTYARLVEGGRLRKRRRECERRWTEQRDGRSLSVGPPAYEDKKAREERIRRLEEREGCIVWRPVLQGGNERDARRMARAVGIHDKSGAGRQAVEVSRPRVQANQEGRCMRHGWRGWKWGADEEARALAEATTEVGGNGEVEAETDGETGQGEAMTDTERADEAVAGADEVLIGANRSVQVGTQAQGGSEEVSSACSWSVDHGHRDEVAEQSVPTRRGAFAGWDAQGGELPYRRLLGDELAGDVVRPRPRRAWWSAGLGRRSDGDRDGGAPLLLAGGRCATQLDRPDRMGVAEEVEQLELERDEAQELPMPLRPESVGDGGADEPEEHEQLSAGTAGRGRDVDGLSATRAWARALGRRSTGGDILRTRLRDLRGLGGLGGLGGLVARREVGEEGVAGDGGSGDNGGRAGLGHRLVAAWARVRAAFGDG